MLDATDRATVLSALREARDFLTPPVHPPVTPGPRARALLAKLDAAVSILAPAARPGWPIPRNGAGAPMADLPDPSADELARLSRAVHALGG